MEKRLVNPYHVYLCCAPCGGQSLGLERLEEFNDYSSPIVFANWHVTTTRTVTLRKKKHNIFKTKITVLDKTSSSVRILHDHSYSRIRGVKVAPRRIPYDTGLPQNPACHAKLAMYRCPSCPYTSHFVTSMRLHRLHLHCNLQFAECMDYKETCYVCDLCSFQTYSLLFFLKHDCPKTYGFTSWYCCSLCEFKSSQLEALQDHQAKTHFSVFLPLKLQYHQGEVNLGNLKHFNAQQSKKGTGKCKKGVMFRKKDGLWQCPLCEFNIYDKNMMIGHVRAHTKLRVSWFQCGRCKFKTKRAECMKKHFCDIDPL